MTEVDESTGKWLFRLFILTPKCFYVDIFLKRKYLKYLKYFHSKNNEKL